MQQGAELALEWGVSIRSDTETGWVDRVVRIEGEGMTSLEAWLGLEGFWGFGHFIRGVASEKYKEC